MTDFRKFIGRLLCRMGRHPKFDLIQSYGTAERIGCPRCGREMAIHHGLRTIVPWDSELAQMYRDMGYDVDAATVKWQRHRAALTEEQP